MPAVFSCLNFSTSSALQLHHTAAKPSTSSSLIYQVPCDSMSGQEMSNTDRATSRGHNSSESTEASGFGTRHREDAGSLISTSRKIVFACIAVLSCRFGYDIVQFSCSIVSIDSLVCLKVGLFFWHGRYPSKRSYVSVSVLCCYHVDDKKLRMLQLRDH